MEKELYNLRKENEELRKEVAKLQAAMKGLTEQLEWFRRQVFGKKSERFIDPSPEQLQLDLKLPEPEEEKPDSVRVAPHSRRKEQNKGVYTLELPDNLERVERVIDVPESERMLPDGTPMVRMGQDVSEKLAFRPGEYYVVRFIRPKYAAANEPNLGVLQEPMPESLIDGSKFHSSFLAHLAVEKFAFHMPLYRIEEKLSGRGIQVARQTLAQLIRTCGEKVQPLIKLMTERLFLQQYLFTDDSPVKMQAKGKCREARIWLYASALPNAPPYQVYQFSKDRSHVHPTDFLKNYQGVIHADAFAAYEKIHADPKRPIRWAACWVHARRYFENAICGDGELRLWVLRCMRKLFRMEKIAWEKNAEVRLRIRREREMPVVEEIFARLKQELFEGRLLPRSKMGKAIAYMLSRKENFTLYLADPNIRMENNTAERGLRKVVIGRKNWMFVGSPKAGESMAALFSLVQTCRTMGIGPQEYLEDIFNRLLSHPYNRLEELLPDQWGIAKGKISADTYAIVTA
jgi:transposase